MKRKVWAILALAVLLTALFCVSALADTSGTLTGSISWTLTDGGRLTISGTGSTPDYDWVNNKSPFSAKNTIESVVKTYFKEGGQHIQINVVDDATLRAAQENPEEYRGLVVRVAGYLAYFTELDRHVQDSIIARTAHGGC